MIDNPTPTEMQRGGYVRVSRRLSPAVDDPWWESPTYGCDLGHVSMMLLKSEHLGRRVCIACFGIACFGDVFPIELDRRVS
jgi:hypothetical protein